MDDRIRIGLWQLNLRARKCVEALRKNGFDAHFLPDQEAVRARVLAECDSAASVGFGGSMSVAGLGIFEDCNSPQRICRVYSIIERRPPLSDIMVLVCGEPLGL